VADETEIRDAVDTARINSLDHPRYEFYYPWDYAAERERGSISNHRFLVDLKRKAFPKFLAELEKRDLISSRLKETFAAEEAYLVNFEKFLNGVQLEETYRLFDDTLSLAPWNDSLRARIYSIYFHLASTQREPVERSRLLRRARALYENLPVTDK
jgi:hypothetical protein